ncbi:MAG: UMP kinase [Candidatus Micrarchaeaceae archaeon]|jgi:uridylate kinase|nr:UMP kinase [Candidatus Micrarchaeota archaeon]HII09680.1 UMP kinase [Candidatus Micrarchaeota archaeon]
MNITIKLSGHILFPSLNASSAFKGYVESILRLRKAGNALFIVVGGGEPGRYYIRIARENGLDESSCDQVGIAATHINARIFARALGSEACQLIPTDFSELDEAISTDKIVVMGGLQPGQSTNAVAAVLAERSNSKLLINTTNVDGIYESDPKKNPRAKRFDKISIGEVEKILDKMGARAGEYDLLDHVAIRIISRSRITTKIIDGSNPKNILKAVEGRIGTTIVP